MDNLQSILNQAVKVAISQNHGHVADYIPELAAIPQDLIGLSVRTTDGQAYYAGDACPPITLQSAAKLVLLIGLLEEFGAKEVFSWVRVEPSGDDFNSIARLDQFGPLASNPMLNAGAITLCNYVPGKDEQQLAWLEKWMETLFNGKCYIDPKVLASERRTGNRNRSLAYLLKSNKVISRLVKDVLELYFSLCSYQVTIEQASYLPMLLANKGKNPEGKQIISLETVRHVVSIMATCGLYNESGTHLVKTGMPSKSAVSGFILSVALGKAGVAIFSPKVNRKGTSVRGEVIAEYLSKQLSWHFCD